MNLYNEIDPYCCDWLENLIREKLIPAGVVDRRSIVDIVPNDLRSFTQCHFFAGLGGWPLALRRAGYPDHRAVWTGSCPCQPFSQAGKKLGFADDRHLWPWWRYLIAVNRPATIFGEQVASAADWLRLVRGDLEALEYAMGTMPVEAASAGADHLRDRFWFMAQSEHCGLGWRESQWNGTGPALSSGEASVEHAARFGRSQGRTEHELWSGRDAASNASSAFDLGNSFGAGAGWNGGSGFGAQAESDSERQFDGSVGDAPVASGTEWVLGADGKSRRVKSGVRLLAHGVPSRVAKLRAFGNAIDPRPAAAFVKASMQALDSPFRF